MNKKDLEKLGLTAEVLEKAELPADLLQQIIVLHGKDIESHKTSLSTAETQVTELQKQLDAANAAVKSFEQMDIEGVKKAATEWETKAKTAQKEADDRIAALKLDHALESALIGEFKVKDPADVLPRLKKDTIKFGEDGKLIGLKEQVETLQTSKAYLFNLESSEDPDPKIIGPTSGGEGLSTDSFTKALYEGAGIPTAKDK